MEEEDQWVGLGRWRRSWVVELPQVEVGVVVPVGFEVQTRRERTAKNVGQKLGDISGGINAKGRDEQTTDWCPIHPARFRPLFLPRVPPNALTGEG